MTTEKRRLVRKGDQLRYPYAYHPGEYIYVEALGDEGAFGHVVVRWLDPEIDKRLVKRESDRIRYLHSGFELVDAPSLVAPPGTSFESPR